MVPKQFATAVNCISLSCVDWVSHGISGYKNDKNVCDLYI